MLVVQFEVAKKVTTKLKRLVAFKSRLDLDECLSAMQQLMSDSV
jgi:hypothetical protein